MHANPFRMYQLATLQSVTVKFFNITGAARTMMKASALSMKAEIPSKMLAALPAFAAMPAMASTDVRFTTIEFCQSLN